MFCMTARSGPGEHKSELRLREQLEKKDAAASSFCPFGPVESFLVANVIIGERRCCSDSCIETSIGWSMARGPGQGGVQVRTRVSESRAASRVVDRTTTEWHRTGSRWFQVRTLPVAPLWCDLGFVPNSRGNKAAANLRPRATMTARRLSKLRGQRKGSESLLGLGERLGSEGASVAGTSN